MTKKPRPTKPTKAVFEEAARLTKEDRYVKRKPRGGRVAALDLLFRHLVEEGRLYESEDIQDQRDAVANAMLAISDFLETQGFPLAAIAPVMRPVAALVEREGNSPDPIFAQRDRAGRPKDTLAHHERKGTLAALANHWLSLRSTDEHSQSDKLSEAARKMNGPWFGKITRAQLETAREFVSQESKDHPAVKKAAMIKDQLEKAADKFGSENAFDIMLHWLNDVPLVVGNGPRRGI